MNIEGMGAEHCSDSEHIIDVIGVVTGRIIDKFDVLGLGIARYKVVAKATGRVIGLNNESGIVFIDDSQLVGRFGG